MEYMKIRPKTNEDGWRSQIDRCINVMPINIIGMRTVNLAVTQDEISLNEFRRRNFGSSNVNCFQNHNLSSILLMLPIHFRTMVDDTIHLPRQNYKFDYIANVCGLRCGCGKEWSKDKRLHNLNDCCM